MFKSLIVIDNDFVDYSIDLIEVASRLAGTEETVIYGLGINLAHKEIAGFDTLICVDCPTIQMKDSRMITDIIEDVQQSYQFDSIIVLATQFGRMVAPRLAMRLKVGLVADITDIEIKEDERRLIRPAYSGNMLASIICDTSPIMFSVHPNVFKWDQERKQPEVVHFPTSKMKASSIEVLSVVADNQSQDIREAEVIVAAGAGFTPDLSQLNEVAEKLNGLIAVSKPLVEQNRATREIQIGQSGKTVSPKLYLALGIYGSMQHIEGLKNVDDIISVNLDEGAPLNYLANIVVIGDAAEFIEKLKAKI